MPEYWMRFKKPPGRGYHRVIAPSKQEAVRKFLKGSTLSERDVHVAKGEPKGEGKWFRPLRRQ